MTSVLPRRSARTVRGGFLVVLLCSLLGGVAHAQSVDQIINSGSANVQYKVSGSSTFSTLAPGGLLPIDGMYDLQNQTSTTAQITSQRLVGSTWTNVFVIKLLPGSQGNFAPVGSVCNVGQWTFTTYYYSGQYVGNLYARVSLSGLVASGPAGSGTAPITTPPVINAWGYESYAGGSRVEATTLDYLRTTGLVQLLGSSDATCTGGTYQVAGQGQYVNWNGSGMVTTRTFPCVNFASLPALSWPGALALLAGLALLVATLPRRGIPSVERA